MIIRGIDFTSRPTRRKPLTCFEGVLEGNTLRFVKIERWSDFHLFERSLSLAGPWITGIDFPFGQARKFIENIDWPRSWSEYCKFAASLDRQRFRSALDEYRKDREYGDREHRRRTDIAASSISPQKLYGVPVALMFYEGVRRLLAADVTVPGLQVGDPRRIVIEAYPGVLARHLIARRSYKHDDPKRQTAALRDARAELLQKILDGHLRQSYGFDVEAPLCLADDPAGDELDSLLCAIQAAWSWSKRSERYGAPVDLDALEGWIADPNLSHAT